MSIRYKAKRNARFFRDAWKCPICKGRNHRDYEGLDTCRKCGVAVHTRYTFDAQLFCTDVVMISENGADAEPLFDETPGPCWCGEKNPYFAPITRGCGGSRTINCICGGDFCVCHWHGETECFGCEDCEPDGDPDDEPAYAAADFEPMP